MKLAALAVLCLWSAIASAPAVAGEAGCFRIFDATGFKLKPDLKQYGIETASVIYVHLHYWPDPTRRQELPERSLVELTVKRLVARDRGPPLLITDLEHWPNKGSDTLVAESVRKYIELAEWTKASAGSSAVGYYGVPPLRDYWRSLSGPTSKEYRAWQAENDRFQALVDAVDVLTPSLYTFYEDEAGWERSTVENIREARRLAPGKPVYPFIWPQYHESNRKLRGQYLPASYWLRQLQILEANVEGVILWHPPGKHWNGMAEWWRATRAFIESSSRVCRP